MNKENIARIFLKHMNKEHGRQFSGTHVQAHP